MPLFETTASANIRPRLAWPRRYFDNCAYFAYALRALDDRTWPEFESKAEAVDSKRAYKWTGAALNVWTDVCLVKRKHFN